MKGCAVRSGAYRAGLSGPAGGPDALRGAGHQPGAGDHSLPGGVAGDAPPSAYPPWAWGTGSAWRVSGTAHRISSGTSPPPGAAGDAGGGCPHPVRGWGCRLSPAIPWRNPTCWASPPGPPWGPCWPCWWGVWLPMGRLSVPTGAFVGALVSILLVYGLSRSGGAVTPVRLILVGVAVSAMFRGLYQLSRLYCPG